MLSDESPGHAVRPLRVFIFYTGVGIIQRGIESFARECFDNLRGLPGLEIELFKGAGPEGPGEHRLWCVPRLHPVASVLGRALGYTGFVVEAATGFLSFIRHLRARRPDVVFVPGGEMNLLLCHKARPWLRVPYRVLLSNGAPEASPFPYADHVQQLNPSLLEEGLRGGEPPGRQSLVPYGIRLPPGPPETLTPDALAAARARLELPTDRPVVLSVGWISCAHKRMDHVVEEVARIPAPRRPFLVLLGHQDAASPPVLALARERLGPGGFAARTVPLAEVEAYYRAADVFALASVREAFGRVFLEALAAGLPCVANDHAIHRYVLGAEGTFVDMERPGALADVLVALLADGPAQRAADVRARRRESVRERFGWETLAPAYLEMFRRAAGWTGSLPGEGST